MQECVEVYVLPKEDQLNKNNSEAVLKRFCNTYRNIETSNIINFKNDVSLSIIKITYEKLF